MTAYHSAKLLIREDADATAQAVRVSCSGAWTVRGIAALEPLLRGMAWPDAAEIEIDGSAISALDTAGAWLLHRTAGEIERQGRRARVCGLRPAFDTLLQLVAAGSVAPLAAAPAPMGMLENVGRQTWRAREQFSALLAFVGECSFSLLQLFPQPLRIRWRALFHNLQSAGFEALPIVGLLSFLLGVVIAYQGADQLRRFGANVYIADLVGLAMLRELAPLLTAIIVAGRSGSAYAAQIGTMKVTEEIDALRTIGIAPQELLVLPKVLALVIALPLLTVFADVTGLLGGMIMARSKLDVGFDVFINRLGDAVSVSSFLAGLVKAPVFAVIIALVGCFQGFRVGGSADSVGRQTTLSVVQSIFLVIVADALFSVVFNWLDI